MYIKNILFFILFSRCLNLKIELKKKFLILNTTFHGMIVKYEMIKMIEKVI